MSSRLFLYENFDQQRYPLIGDSADHPALDPAKLDASPHREFEIARRECFEAGRAHGFAEGRQAALQEAEAVLARGLPDLLCDLGGAAAEMAGVKRACERDALLLAEAALRKMLPIVAERGLDHEAAALVAEVIANVPVPTLEVRVSARTREVIERRGDQVPSGVTLITDAAAPHGGVRCTWPDGEACFDGAALQQAILAILDRHLDRTDHAHVTCPCPEQDAQLQKD